MALASSTDETTGLEASQAGRARPILQGATGLVVIAMATFVLVRLELYDLALPAATLAAVTATSFVLFACAAPLSCIAAAVSAPRHERPSWALLALGSGLMVAGDGLALATGGTAALGAAPSLPGAATVWVSSFAAFFVAALGFLDPPGSDVLGRIRRVMDIALVVLIVAAVVFASTLFPAFGHDVRRELTAGLMSYAALVLSASLLVIIALYRPPFRLWHLPLTVALVSVAAGSLAQTLLAGRSLPDATAGLERVLDVPWLVAYAALTLAAVVRTRHRTATLHVVEHDRRPSRTWIPVATVAMTFVAMPAFVYLGISWEGDPVGYWVFAGLAGLLGLLAIARNVVLTIENTSLRARTVVDPLTDLFNHRFFHERLAVEIERARRDDSPLALICIDLDDFDQVNNVYGHAAGDRRLRAVADALRAAARSTDVLCRVGGDEFALIMPATTSVDAYKVCLRLQDAARFADAECPLPTGFSAGIAAMPEHAESRDDLLRKADGALYWAKLHGREQIVVYDPELIVALGPEQRIELLEEESYVRMVQLLASAVDARDPYTQQHSRRVAALAVGFAQALGMSEDHLERLRIAALLHDVGKIGVPDAVLRKPDRLDEAEYRQVKEHPHLAVRILQAIPHADILPWIRCHHERWDGRGYPDGLAAEDIPVEARILAICDAYDAMTSSRPYRPAMLTAEALAEIDANAGTQFDADLAELFVIFINDQERLAARGDTAPLLESAIA